VDRSPCLEPHRDCDNDGIVEDPDVDTDVDKIPDAIEGKDDPDGDNIPNYLDTDPDGDNKPDVDDPPSRSVDSKSDCVHLCNLERAILWVLLLVTLTILVLFILILRRQRRIGV